MKQYTIIAGPNGCGKTTLYRSVLKDCGIVLGERISADEIRKKQGLCDFGAARVVDLRAKQCIKDDISFNQETTLAAVTFLDAFVLPAIESGYQVYMYYTIVATPKLAHKRAEEGKNIRKDRDHSVDFDVLKKRFFLSQKVFPRIFPYCSYVEVFDNTNDMDLIWRTDNGELVFLNEELIKTSITKYLFDSISK